MGRLPRAPRDDVAAPPTAAQYAGLRLGTIAAGGALVLMLLGAGAVALLGGGGAGPVPAVRPPIASTAAVPAGPALRPERAGTTPAAGPSAGVEPLLTPPAVRWELFAGVALPYSPEAGPTMVDGPVYSGFERSQPGALLAAAHLGVRYLLTPGQGWRQVLERQVLPGAGRDTYASNRAGVEPDDPPGTYGQYAGFRIVAYTGDVAVIQLASRFALTGRLQVSTSTVKWVGDDAGGDWRLEVQPDGGTSPTAQAVADLDGFVVWGGI